MEKVATGFNSPFSRPDIPSKPATSAKSQPYAGSTARFSQHPISIPIPISISSLSSFLTPHHPMPPRPSSSLPSNSAIPFSDRSPTTSPPPPTIPRPPTTIPLSPPRLAPRPLILSISIAAIAATGAWYGASLKTSRETQLEVKQQLTAPPKARIAYLEERRARMVGVKQGLETRIEGLQDSQRERGEKR